MTIVRITEAQNKYEFVYSELNIILFIPHRRSDISPIYILVLRSRVPNNQHKNIKIHKSSLKMNHKEVIHSERLRVVLKTLVQT